MTEQASKRCPRCGESKRLEAFSRNRSKPDGRGCYCRGCEAERWQQGRSKRARRHRPRVDLPGQPGFGNQGRPRAPRAKANTLEELLEAW